METKDDKKVKETSVRPGIPMSEESLKEYEQTWIDIEESIEYVKKRGKNV